MAAPDHVPVPLSEQPRTALAIPPPRRWTANRPADLQGGQPLGPKLGRPGPDQGYALVLADRMKDKVRVTQGEHAADAVAGAVAVALKRASMFGRAPVTQDFEVALKVWGFLDDDPPAELVEARTRLFPGAAHHYWDQQAVADAVPESTLRLTPAEVSKRAPQEWRQLLEV